MTNIIPTLVITVITTIIATIILEVLALIFIKPISLFFLKLRNKKQDAIIEYWNNKKKITVLNKKRSVRISIAIFAKIGKGNKFLLIQDKVVDGRKDDLIKPIGGVIKISDYADKKLRKLHYKTDNQSRYNAKGNDFRIFVNIKNTKLINHIIYNETNEFYKNELKREMIEELKIDENQFNKVFSIEEQPTNIESWMKTPSQSILKIDSMDYQQSIIFKVNVKDSKELEEIVKENKEIKWVDLSRCGTNVAVTAKWLSDCKEVKHFKVK